MKVAVAPEAEQDLTDGALYYAQEANAELGLAFIAEFERTLSVLTAHPRVRHGGRGLIASHFAAFPIASSTEFTVRSYASSHSRTSVVSPGIGLAENSHRSTPCCGGG